MQCLLQSTQQLCLLSATVKTAQSDARLDLSVKIATTADSYGKHLRLLYIEGDLLGGMVAAVCFNPAYPLLHNAVQLGSVLVDVVSRMRQHGQPARGTD